MCKLVKYDINSWENQEGSAGEWRVNQVYYYCMCLKLSLPND